MKKNTYNTKKAETLEAFSHRNKIELGEIMQQIHSLWMPI